VEADLLAGPAQSTDALVGECDAWLVPSIRVGPFGGELLDCFG